MGITGDYWIATAFKVSERSKYCKTYTIIRRCISRRSGSIPSRCEAESGSHPTLKQKSSLKPNTTLHTFLYESFGFPSHTITMHLLETVTLSSLNNRSLEREYRIYVCIRRYYVYITVLFLTQKRKLRTRHS